MKNESSHVMTVKELSDYLKVHPSTIYRQLKRGRLAWRDGTGPPRVNRIHHPDELLHPEDRDGNG